MSETTASLIAIAANPKLAENLHSVIRTYCHQVRNHLNSLKMSLYFAKRGSSAEGSPAWSHLNTQYQEMEQWLERLQMLCRPLSLDLYELPFDLVIEEHRKRWVESAERAGGTLAVAPAEISASVRIDLGKWAQVLDDLAEWRFRAAPRGTKFQLDWKLDGNVLAFRWSESSGRLLEPSVEGFTQDPEQGPLSREGLVLPMIHRLAVLHGGSAELSVEDGWRLTLRLPGKPSGASQATSSGSDLSPARGEKGA